MKKLFAAFAVLAFAATAQANDNTGKLGLGYQSSLAGGAGSWSVKYGIASNLTAQATIGASFNKGDDNDPIAFGARVLYDIVEGENSDFYTGLGLRYEIQPDASTSLNGFGEDTIVVNVPLGFEFSLANAPAVAFSAEMGLNYTYGTNSKAWNLATVGGGLGTVFGAGAHYYF
ncbi:MAG: hypothetical protein KDD52_03175 [Bdellovibrionales bacterium]|nr:hypothetical protein [Bdellovibrionales bacterium]